MRNPKQAAQQLSREASRQLVRFARGLLGFVGVTEFRLIARPEEYPFQWLEMVEDPARSFLVVQPEAVYKSSPGLLARYALRYPPADKAKDSKDSTVIRIDQIRALIEASQTRPQIDARKVLILSPADTHNVNAANSLLKLLGEPPPDSHLILVADRPARLPATIRSRCTRVDFRLPGTDVARAWLQGQGLAGADADRLLALAGGAPLEAQVLAGGDFLARREVLIADLEALLAGRGDPLASFGFTPS